LREIKPFSAACSFVPKEEQKNIGLY